MKPNEIIKWYETFTPDQGLDKLLEMRQHLSCAVVRISETIGKLEKEHKALYAERKTQEAIKFLESEETTDQKRRADTQKKIGDLVSEENVCEGSLRGAKIYHASLCEVLNSMSSYINVMNR